jgi:hypothetical protein
MSYYIISKIEIDGSSHMTNIFGYTTSLEDSNAINEHHDSCLGAWLTENGDSLQDGSMTVSEYFETNPACYSATDVVTDISIFGEITEITDITDLI